MDGMFSSRRLVYAASAIGVGAGAYVAINYLTGGSLSLKRFYAGRQEFHAMDDYPDLRHHNNCMATHLSPRLYTKLKSKTTPNGFTLDQAIQTGWCVASCLLFRLNFCLSSCLLEKRAPKNVVFYISFLYLSTVYLNVFVRLVSLFFVCLPICFLMIYCSLFVFLVYM